MTFSIVLNFATASVKIPQTFLSLIIISFGHLISGFLIPIFSSVFATATPVANVIKGSLEWSTWGFKTIDNHAPPNGEFHTFPDLPLAAVCFSEIITLPSAIPFADKNLAILFVDWTSWNTYKFLPIYFVFKFSAILSALIYSVSCFPISSTMDLKSLISTCFSSSMVFSEILFSFVNKFTISSFIIKSPVYFFCKNWFLLMFW